MARDPGYLWGASKDPNDVDVGPQDLYPVHHVTPLFHMTDTNVIFMSPKQYILQPESLLSNINPLSKRESIFLIEQKTGRIQQKLFHILL